MRDLENKVIYQIYPKSFKDTTGNGYGDINGIIEKLDYIQDLGVDYIWLSPCCKSPQNDNGYDISDYMQIDELFGTNEDYERLIKEAKKRNIKIMMDLVLNHTSSEHIWFKKALQKDSRYYDYYIWRDEPNDINSMFGGSAWAYSEEVGKYYFRLFDKTQPDLNWENENVRKDLYEMINYWIGKGVEGFRLDVIDLIGKEPDKMITGKGPKFYEYLKELNNNTFKDKILTVGECWCSTIDESYKMCNKDGLTQAFHFTHQCLTHTYGDKWNQSKINLYKLCDCINKWENEYTGIEAIVMNNHDLPRLISLWLNDNEYRKESAKLLITLFGLLKGNLYIYQGEEIGMTNAYFNSIDKYRDVETLNKYNELKEKGLSEDSIMEIIKLVSRDNARIPMQWDDTKNAGFSDVAPWIDVNDNYNKINVKKDINSEDSVFNYYKNIIKFRKENYEKIEKKATFNTDGKIISMEKEDFIVYANFTNENIEIPLGNDILFKNYENTKNNLLRPFETIVVKK
ncbi:alpha-glucosidase [uncultured Tyzzerella sp.]|uniref:alpha-glucosidase n=1 Tax=uncultured Tyzzerella sp. TaxID=2321398 RepID=UPI002943DA0E|nr:alpha-glucosidase [uncultured Tyzzerella sp.]